MSAEPLFTLTVRRRVDGDLFETVRPALSRESVRVEIELALASARFVDASLIPWQADALEGLAARHERLKREHCGP